MAKRCTSSFASFVFIMRWSRINITHLFCCDLGKNTMNLLLWIACEVFLPPLYVCCKLITDVTLCRAVRTGIIRGPRLRNR